MREKFLGGSLDDLQELEAFLSATLTPVEPRPEFITGLRQRLLQQGMLESDPTHFMQYILLGGAGILSSFLLFRTGGPASRLARRFRQEKVAENGPIRLPTAS